MLKGLCEHLKLTQKLVLLKIDDTYIKIRQSSHIQSIFRSYEKHTVYQCITFIGAKRYTVVSK